MQIVVYKIINFYLKMMKPIYINLYICLRLYEHEKCGCLLGCCHIIEKKGKANVGRRKKRKRKKRARKK